MLLLDELAPDQTRRVRVRARLRAGAALGAFIAGILGGLAVRDLVPPGPVFALTCVLGGASLLTGPRATRVLLLLAVAGLGAAWLLLRTAPPSGPGALLVEQLPSGLERPAPITVEGLVLERPELRHPPEGFVGIGPSARFRLSITSASTDSGPVPMSGVLRVSAPARARDGVSAGDFVRLSGLARAPDPPMNPGERDDRLWRRQAGEVGSISVPSARLIEAAESPSFLRRAQAGWIAFRASVRDRAERLLGERLLGERDDGADDRAHALLRAVILGQREHGDEAGEDQDAFTRLGLAHLMAISGMHVAILAWSALLAVRLVSSLLARDAGWIEPTLVALLILIYLVIVPLNAPVLRASIMILALLIAEALGRRHDRVAVLAWTALVILLFRPLDALSMGFQLSFALVASLMVLAPRIHEGLYGPRIITDLPTPERWWHAPGAWLRGLVSASLACWLISTPIVIAHTGLVSPFAVLTTVIVLPLLMLTLLIAYSSLLAGIIAPPIASALGGLISMLASWTLWLVRHLDAIPGTSLTLPRISTAWTIAACALLALWMWRERLTDRRMWLCALILGAWLGAEVWSRTRVPDHIRLRIDMLSVGDATCTLLRSGDDAMLWDCGAGAPGAGKRRIPRSIRAVGAWRTPTAVITHPNFDHYNALTDAGEPLGVTRLLVPARLIAEVRSEAGRGDGGALPALMSAMEERGVQTAVLSAGDEFDFGACRIEILSPPAGASWKETNDHSLVARIVVPVAGGQRTVLLTGDIQNDAIEALLEAHPDLHADVLEIPHHGAPTDDAYALLALTDPDVVLQSAGRKRAADTRWDAVKTDRRWLTTGRHGAAWVEIRATGAIRAGAMHAER